jgi:hypothetical protein
MTEQGDTHSSEGDPRREPRDAMKFGLGVFLGFLSAISGLAVFVFIWFGVFPGLIALMLAIPLGWWAVHLIRKGRPPHSD